MAFYLFIYTFIRKLWSIINEYAINLYYKCIILTVPVAYSLTHLYVGGTSCEFKFESFE